MKLPHYKSSKASVEKWEPLYTNLFEVSILPPAGVSGTELLLEHVKNITGLTTEPGQDAVEQTYKTAKRSFLSTVPTNTVVDLGITFTLNLNNDNENYIYKALRDWKRIGYNPLTGEMGLKKDYADAKIIVTMYNRAGDIHWQRTFHSVFIVGDIPAIDLDYSTGDPAEITVTFRSDYWTEQQV